MRKKYLFAILLALLVTGTLSVWQRLHSRQGPARLALEECDPAGYVPCVQQTAFLSVPIADTNVYLTYSSQWAKSRDGQRDWDARSLGLGGWSINLVQRYDSKNRVIFSGDGTWRMANAVRLPSGETTVPNFDGSLAYVFDSTGRHIRTVDGHLGTTLLTVVYDSAERLARLDGSSAGQPVHISVRRAQDGTPTQLVGIDGSATTLQLDGSRHLIGIIDPAGEKRQIEWSTEGQVISQTDPLGSATRFAYDAFGQLTSTTDADGVRQQFDRKAFGDGIEIRVSTPLGRHTAYRAETVGGGIRRTFIAADGTSSTETTDSNGTRTLHLADGTTWTVGAVSNPVWGMAAPILTPIVETRPDGVTSRGEVRDSLQSLQGLPYVLAGSVTTTINGQTWTQDFDPAQRTVSLVDPTAHRTISTYDAEGRLVSYSAPGTAPISYTYNADGRKVSETIGTGARAETITYGYDSNSGEMTITRPDGIVETAKADRVGRTISVSTEDGSTIVAAYDAAGRLMQLQPPDGSIFTLGHSPAGRPTGFAPPIVKDDASVEVTSYDADGRPAAIAGLGNRAVNISYDSAGKVVSWTFDRGKATVSYDPRSGLISQAVDPGGVNTQYGYAGSAPDRLSWSGPINGSVSVSLDANGRAVSETVNKANSLNLKYDSAGDLTAVGPLSLNRNATSGLVTHTSLGVVSTNQEFDADGELIRSIATAGGRTLLDSRYTYDTMGRIKAVEETVSDGGTFTTQYSYDSAARLAGVHLNGRAVETDTYDAAGNRISITRPSASVKAAYDDRDRLTNWGSSSYTWAPDGALMRRDDATGATQFNYDDFGALRKVILPDHRKIEYLIDAQGRRVGRAVNGELVAGYLYSIDGFIAADTDATGKITSRFGFDEAGHLALLERDGTTYRVITDCVGSPRLVIDSKTGAVADAIDYDTWGNITHETASNFIPLGFAGGLRDPDTGLVHFGARDYDPTTGRWTAADPMRFDSTDTNLYRYTLDDPLNLVDRAGLDSSSQTITLTSETVHTPNGTWNISSNTGGGLWGNYEPNPQMITIVAAWKPRTPPQGDVQFGPVTYSYNPPDGNISQGGGGGGGGGNGPGNGGNGPGNGGGGGGNGPGNGGNGPGNGGGGGGSGNGPGNGGNGPGNGGGGGGGGNGPGNGGNGPGNGGGGGGDPHVYTTTDLRFDFQAAGEFLIATSPDGKFVVQARQQPWGTMVALNTAVAANVDGDRIGVYAREPVFLMVNGSAVSESEIAKRKLPHGGTIERHGDSVNVRWPDNSRLTIQRIADSLNYRFVPGPELAPTVRGLLGKGNGSGSKVLTSRDGSTLNLSDQDFPAKLYRQFGDSWRINQSESLFHYWPGESTAKFTDLTIPHKPVSAASLASADHSRAETICRAFGLRIQPTLDDCILDVGLTGMPGYVGASVAMALNANPTSISGTSSNSSSPSFGAITPATAADEFAIRIGDTVSPDRPAAGAGIIKHSGQQQTYSFSVGAPTNIYVGGGPCDGAVPRFDVLQADNNVVGGRIGCGDFGPLTLPKGGVYRIAVKADGPSARYSFTLRAASSDQFSIRIGDTVSPDHPTPGAGIIKEPGQKQSYTFEGHTGEAIFLALGPCEGANPSFSVIAPDNSTLDGAIGNCHVNLRDTLPASGTYRIVASTDKSQVASRYGFSLRPVPADQHFAVRLPLTVSPGVPARGAGYVSAPGAQQFFDFDAKPGTKVHIEGRCGGSCPNLLIRAARVRDLTAYFFFDLNATNGDWTLPEGGKYTIQVRSNGYTGNYSFVAREAVPQRH